MWADRFRWSLILGALVALDSRATNETWLLATRPVGRSPGRGPMNAHFGWESYADGRAYRTVTNHLTGVTTSTLIRPATPTGRIVAAWPAIAASAFTLLAISVARTRRGWRAVRAVLRVPRLSTRGWMILIGVGGGDFGLLVAGLRSSGIDPARDPWGLVVLPLLAINAVAFLPAGIVALHKILTRKPEIPADPT